jgi:hypothetical protein
MELGEVLRLSEKNIRQDCLGLPHLYITSVVYTMETMREELRQLHSCIRRTFSGEDLQRRRGGGSSRGRGKDPFIIATDRKPRLIFIIRII